MTLQIRTVAMQAADASKTKNAPLDVRRAIQAATDEKAGTRQDSAKVTLSDSGKAQVKMLQFQQGMNSIGEARKSAARAHAAQIKQQIEALKKIAVTLGPMASKALLRQIKHLVQQVRQIAAELAQSSIVSNPGEAALNGDLSVDAHVDFGAGTEDGEGASTADAEREAVMAQAEASTGEAEKEEGDDEGEGNGAAAAQAEQAVQSAQSAEREIQAQEAREDDKKGAVGNAGSGAARGDAWQEDALLVRDLARELRLLLSLAKGALLKKDKEDKENIEEIEAALSDINDLAGKLEAAAQSTTDAEAAITAEASGAASVDTAVGDAAVSISVFA